jgi:AraC-like DNA-binding protein
MFETFESKEINDLAVDNAIFDFLDYILKYHSTIKENQIIEDKKTTKSFSSTIDFIDANIRDLNISLDDLSKNAGLSKFHFSREFKRNFGISPSHFVQIKKVNKVRELLKTDMSLSTIAYESGFSDQSYMIKVFRKYSGYTPSLIKKVSS